jgi:flagellar biogenesis protein FliO
MFAALAVVFGLFLSGIWIFKKTRFFSMYQGAPAQLRVLETRSLGYRNTLMVIAYSHHRFLVGVSASGVHLVSALPDVVPAEESVPVGNSPFSKQLSALQSSKPGQGATT